jgi:hypothetical protein
LKLPSNAATFVGSVKADCKQLIELGLWDIKMARLESWTKQFYGEEEEFFAACLLDQIIFRTKQQFESGLRSLIRSNLNGKLFQGVPDLELMQRLSSKDDPHLRLVPVICETDPPTKSGPLVMRRLQRILQLNQEWMCWPWQATKYVESNGVNTIIFVDDFLGSGTQFVTFFKQWGFDKLHPEIRCFYAPVVAHQQGLGYLAGELPKVNVVPAEVLSESHNFFAEKVWARLGQGEISVEEARDWYLDFCTKRNLKPHKVGMLGYNDMALTFGFGHATPNNTLPILWNETANWQPLLER